MVITPRLTRIPLRVKRKERYTRIHSGILNGLVVIETIIQIIQIFLIKRFRLFSNSFF